MTENLAGRGEGLAGLVAAHAGWKRGDSRLPGETPVRCRCGTIIQPDYRTGDTHKHWTKHFLAALEAAAPPSTTHARTLGQLLGRIHERFNQREPHTGAWDAQRIVVAEVIQAALATHSTQAPAADIESLAATFHAIYQAEARRQGDVRHKDAYADLPENVKEFDRVLARYVLLNFEVGRIAPAATQEQPAGSGAASLQATKDETRGDVCEGNAPRLLAESPSTFGSPRKVGEDGARKVGSDE